MLNHIFKYKTPSCLNNLISGNETTTLKIVCAWCGADMGTKDGQGITGITHGICPDCFNRTSCPYDQKGMCFTRSCAGCDVFLDAIGKANGGGCGIGGALKIAANMDDYWKMRASGTEEP